MRNTSVHERYTSVQTSLLVKLVRLYTAQFNVTNMYTHTNCHTNFFSFPHCLLLSLSVSHFSSISSSCIFPLSFFSTFSSSLILFLFIPLFFIGFILFFPFFPSLSLSSYVSLFSSSLSPSTYPLSLSYLDLTVKMHSFPNTFREDTGPNFSN